MSISLRLPDICTFDRLRGFFAEYHWLTATEIILEVANLDELNTVVIVSHDLATTTALSDTLWLLGPERDAAGECIPGATITESHRYNLAAMGLAWQHGIQAKPEFVDLIEHLKEEIRRS